MSHLTSCGCKTETGFPWLSTAGTAEITTHHATVKGTIALGASNGKPTVRCTLTCGLLHGPTAACVVNNLQRQPPQVSPADVKADVGKFDIKFNDGIIGDLANLLENLFSNQIKNAVRAEGAVCKAGNRQPTLCSHAFLRVLYPSAGQHGAERPDQRH